MKFIDIQKLKNTLPAHPGILGKEEYFNSAVLIPLVRLKGEHHLLFEKRAEHIRQGGEICFPGGEIDPYTDGNPVETALRETEEEIGIKKENINVIGILDTLLGPRGVTVDSCVGELNMDSLDECSIDRSEVAKVFTVPVSFFVNRSPEIYTAESKLNYTFYNPDGKVEDLIPSRKNSLNDHIDKSYTRTRRNVLVYKTNEEVIWGITARLVNELVGKIQKSL